MSERQPIRPICEPGIPSIADRKSVTHHYEPAVQRRESARTRHYAAHTDDGFKLGEQRECGNAAENQSDDEKPSTTL